MHSVYSAHSANSNTAEEVQCASFCQLFIQALIQGLDVKRLDLCDIQSLCGTGIFYLCIDELCNNTFTVISPRFP